jgi:hypothetical protein
LGLGGTSTFLTGGGASTFLGGSSFFYGTTSFFLISSTFLMFYLTSSTCLVTCLVTLEVSSGCFLSLLEEGYCYWVGATINLVADSMCDWLLSGALRDVKSA